MGYFYCPLFHTIVQMFHVKHHIHFSNEREIDMSEHALVLQSDFGIDDGAVSAMYGVANTVSSSIRILI